MVKYLGKSANCRNLQISVKIRWKIYVSSIEKCLMKWFGKGGNEISNLLLCNICMTFWDNVEIGEMLQMYSNYVRKIIFLVVTYCIILH